MADPSRYSDSTVPGSEGQPLKRLGRTRVYAATVAEDEHAAITEAVTQAGYPRPSVAARVILMAFARSAEVRDAVSRWLRGHGPEVL
jgi:hypothetical protein